MEILEGWRPKRRPDTCADPKHQEPSLFYWNQRFCLQGLHCLLRMRFQMKWDLFGCTEPSSQFRRHKHKESVAQASITFSQAWIPQRNLYLTRSVNWLPLANKEKIWSTEAAADVAFLWNEWACRAHHENSSFAGGHKLEWCRQPYWKRHTHLKLVCNNAPVGREHSLTQLCPDQGNTGLSLAFKRLKIRKSRLSRAWAREGLRFQDR